MGSIDRVQEQDLTESRTEEQSKRVTSPETKAALNGSAILRKSARLMKYVPRELVVKKDKEREAEASHSYELLYI